MRDPMLEHDEVVSQSNTEQQVENIISFSIPVDDPKNNVTPEELSKSEPVLTPKEKSQLQKPAKKTKSKDAKKIALYSDKNLHIGAASLKIGYNIVSEEAAEKWLKNKSVRKATPEEVKTAFGG